MNVRLSQFFILELEWDGCQHRIKSCALAGIWCIIAVSGSVVSVPQHEV